MKHREERERRRTRWAVCLLSWVGGYLFLWGGSYAEARGRTFALLVGINQYRYADGLDFKNLHQTLNDVRRVREILPLFGFEASSIRVLTDGGATKQAIVAEMRAIQKEVRPGDRVVFYFSGHGFQLSQILRGQKPSTESTLVVHDTQIAQAETHLLGSYLEGWRGSLRTHKVVFLLDACHSGGLLTKSARQPCQGRGLARFVRNPAFLNDLPEKPGPRAIRLRRRFPPPPLYQSGLPVTLMAAHYHQFACESGREQGGVFTLLLVASLRKLLSKPQATFGELFTQIQKGLGQEPYSVFQQDQTPRMLGPTDAPMLFREIVQLPAPSTPATSEPSRACQVQGGLCVTFWLAAHGDLQRRAKRSVAEGSFAILYFSTTKESLVRLWFQSTEGQITRVFAGMITKPGQIYSIPENPKLGFRAKGPPGPVRFFFEAWPLSNAAGRKENFQPAKASEAALPAERRPVRIQETIQVAAKEEPGP